MGKVKKISAMFIAVIMLFSCIVLTTPTNTKAADSTAWAKEAIVSPADGKLVGAGYIDLKWNNNLDNVKQYRVYVDNTQKTAVSPSEDEVMAYEFYTTSVKEYTLKIVAELNNGTEVESATSKFYVTKKGVCVNQDDMGVAVDPVDMNIGWYYNWGYKSFADLNYKNHAFDDTEFVAMTWGDSINDIPTRCAYANKKGYKYLLSYNEPDLTWESNKQPATMVLRWNDTVDNKGSLRLGSPATETFQINSDWWSTFWGGLSTTAKNNMSFIAVHAYQHYYDDADTALQYLHAIDEIYATYHKPIWITEFAVADSGNKFSPTNSEHVAKVQEFMKIVLKGLNERSYVERYAWFNFNPEDDQTGASGIFNYETGKLTTLGQIYANIGNPAGYDSKTYSVSSTTTRDTSIGACVAAVDTTMYDLTAKKQAFAYSFKPVKRAAGYELQYSLSSSFDSAGKYKTTTKTIGASSSTTISGTIKNLGKAKKKYYVRVRAYKTLNGVKYYCKWSKVKSVSTIEQLAKVSKVTAKNNRKNTIKITWNKIANAKSYQVNVGSKSYTVKNKTSLIVKGLRKGKKYAVKIRAKATGYQTGAWSKATTVTINK